VGPGEANHLDAQNPGFIGSGFHSSSEGGPFGETVVDIELLLSRPSSPKDSMTFQLKLADCNLKPVAEFQSFDDLQRSMLSDDAVVFVIME
jgi:hypothetical protein